MKIRLINKVKQLKKTFVELSWQVRLSEADGCQFRSLF